MLVMGELRLMLIALEKAAVAPCRFGRILRSQSRFIAREVRLPCADLVRVVMLRETLNPGTLRP